jgi:acyl-coenzyme A thioesterase PaaI-like protein
MFQVLVDAESEHLPKPVTLTVAYLRSAGPRDTYARATITKQGRRVVSVRVDAWQEDPEKPVATAQGQFLVPSD